MTNFLAVGAGGFIGAALRYGVCLFMISRAGLNSAWGTFCVNFIGCLLIGFLAGFEFKNIQPLKYFLIAGLLGGFTTFSAFSLDALMLLGGRRRRGRPRMRWLDGITESMDMSLSELRTGRPGVLRFMGSQRVGYGCATELN